MKTLAVVGITLAVIGLMIGAGWPRQQGLVPASMPAATLLAPEHGSNAEAEPRLPASPSTSTTDNGRWLGIQRDRSGSGNESQLRSIMPAFVRRIHDHADSIDGVAVTLVANGNRPTLAEPIETFWWGRLDIKPFAEPSTENAPLEVRIFADRKRRWVEQARAKYEQDKERSMREFYARVDHELERLSDYLLQPPTEGAPCTRFSSIAARIERDNYSRDILITDGWLDCGNERKREPAPVSPGGKLVVIQLTRNGDTAVNESELRARESSLRRLFPSARIMPAYMAAEAVDVLFKD